jgi:hypothetical protein
VITRYGYQQPCQRIGVALPAPQSLSLARSDSGAYNQTRGTTGEHRELLIESLILRALQQ